MKYWWIVISNTVDRRCWERCHKIRDPDYQSIGIHVKTHFESAFLSLILENLYFGYVLWQSISPLNGESNWYHLISYCQIFLVRTHVILKKRHYGIDAGNEKLSESGSQMLKTGETQKIPQVWKRWKFFHMFRILLTENIFEKLQRKLFPFPRVDHLGLCKFYFVTLLQVSAEDWTNLEECWTIDIIQSIVYLQCFLEDGGSPLPGGAPKKLVGEGVELFPHVRNCLHFCLCLGAEELT